MPAVQSEQYPQYRAWQIGSTDQPSQRIQPIHQEGPRHVGRGNKRYRTRRGDYNKLYDPSARPLL